MTFIDQNWSNQEFDEHFETLGKTGLQYYPWVGSDYLNSNQKILIVGESHYSDNDVKSYELHKEPKLTRVVVEKIGIERQYRNTKTFSNLHKALVGNDDFESKVLWDSVSFYNFVQRPMMGLGEKPLKRDFVDGWRVFFNIVDIIKPDISIFVGVRASDFLHTSIVQSNYSLTKFEKNKKISRTYARNVIIENQEKAQLNMAFIQHSGHHFSWSKWHEHLMELPFGELELLKKRIEKQLK
ncbi:MAG: hypothetical protein CML04_10050 [Pseudozobellia sp.]|nr:hypothetical protein [Pseudozobellia sp.]MBG47151.1 hypothetical protein [Pseudozobellia sp.]|tara:strand:- start:868 stop:1587 length:720 start_codon:yes stop_codon:yes gene_type:complete